MDTSWEFGVMNQLNIAIVIDLSTGRRYTDDEGEAIDVAFRNQEIARSVGDRDTAYRIVKRRVSRGRWFDA